MQREKLLVVIALIAITNGHREEPHEYEEESVRHIDYEKDQMPIKMSQSEGSNKVKRMANHYAEAPSQYERESVSHIVNENDQTPAEDRAGHTWQVKQKPKVKRMSAAKNGRKVHIYLKNEESKPTKGSKPTTAAGSTTTSASTTAKVASERSQQEVITESQTRRTPESTTRSDNDVRQLQYVDKDSIASGSINSQQSVTPKSDSLTDESSHYDNVIKEKIKIKHHHHHHHHNHVKTVVKKEPYPVEKIVHVPVEKIVEKFIEKKVPYKVEVPVEKIVEKVRKF